MRNTLLSFSLFASQLISYTLGNPIPRPPVVFNAKLTWGVGRPDGVDREMIFTNGVFPAPDLNVEQGDAVEVCVAVGALSYTILTFPSLLLRMPSPLQPLYTSMELSMVSQNLPRR